MQFESWQAFFHMGGYALYVWLSFGVSVIAMAWIVIDSRMSHKQLLKKARQEQARQARIAAARRNQMANPETQQVGK
ncbi:heme exporter protein CcmD [Alteromonas gilva]|uniref:Heme exporter protein D n=1 Tax=Alteromonas gilva TaxID=2987522 RepID=A0ABT5L6K0_9ALTE|nr:heme exporter protein CcmD [Alteromonas gilva]MDC8832664.1 heme exporter protein CcmD [Alteromonas gilva]